MRLWIKRFSAGLAVLLMTGCGDGTPGLRVLETHVEQAKDAYYLDARLDYDFNETVLEALHNGVPLTIEVESRVQRPRRWLWAETLVRNRLRFTLSYHTLSGQYLVRLGAGGRQRSFPGLDAALESMREISDWTLIRGPGVPNRLRYGVRVHLDLDELPAPLRLVAYFSPAWRMGSAWTGGAVSP